MRPRGTKLLWISGKRWEVIFTSEPIITDGETNLGVCLINDQIIKVCTKSKSQDVIRSSLLHEVLHAIVKSQLNTHSSDEEHCVMANEVGIYSIIRDKRNKWFWKVMFSDD